MAASARMSSWKVPLVYLPRLLASMLTCTALGGCFASDRRPELAGAPDDRGTRTDDTSATPDDSRAPDADVDSSRAVTSACSPARPPGFDNRPKFADVAAVPDIHLVWSRVSITGNDAIGLDLDETCTSAPNCSADRAGSCRSSGERVATDAANCRDNALATVVEVASQITTLGSAFGVNDESLTCGLRTGRSNLLTRVTGYNGLPDDPQVRVDWYTTAVLSSTGSPRCDGPFSFRRSTPMNVDERQLSEATSMSSELPYSRVFDAEAYVRNGRLVSRMPSGAALRLHAGPDAFHPFVLELEGAYWLAELSKQQDGNWRARAGVLAGRIRTEAFLRALREVGFCEGNSGALAQQVVDMFVRESADLLASGESDANRSCDALSFGFGFDAVEVTPGVGQALPERVECCAPGRSLDECAARCGDGRVNGDEKCDVAIRAGEAGACPTVCPPLDACSPRVLMSGECGAECVLATLAVGASDGCCPGGANANTDVDCKPKCGNEVLEAGETCDPPSACKACATNECASTRIIGSAEQCNLRCEFVPTTTCASGDRCCPATCSAATDDDCSSTCGNGILDSNETCETGTNQPCPSDCDDDEACTVDRRFGSPANCNVTCMHTAITEARNGDGCCPPGSPAGDDDCRAICGNKAVEASEMCDDGNQIPGDGCFNCRSESPQQQCAAVLGQSDACAQCKCARCASQVMGCYANDIASDAAACKDLVTCSYRVGCGNPDCFCGDTSLFTCFSGGGNGPCKRETEAAAKSDSIFDIDARSTDLSYPIGRANAFFTCTEMNCSADCGF